MRSLWNRRPTQSPITVGQFVEDPGTPGEFQLYQNGAYYSKPNSLQAPAVGIPALSLDFGFGQQVTLDFGGFMAAPE